MMRLNSGTELITGLSDVPLFAVSIVMTAISAGYRKKGTLGRGWFTLCMTVSVTLLGGILLHILHMDEKYLRILWPLEYALITALTAMLWIQILRLFRPEAATKRNIAIMTVFAAAVSIVNGIVRFLYGYDLNPVYCIFGVPAVLHIAFSVLSCRDSRRKAVKRDFAVMAVFLMLAIAAESAIQKPVMVFGLPCKGAVFSHALIIVAMLIVTGMIRTTSEEDDAQE